MLCKLQWFQNFQVLKLSKYDSSLISIQFHMHSGDSLHDGLLLLSQHRHALYSTIYISFIL
jgi:hypothetical protein